MGSGSEQLTDGRLRHHHTDDDADDHDDGDNRQDDFSSLVHVFHFEFLLCKI